MEHKKSWNPFKKVKSKPGPSSSNVSTVNAPEYKDPTLKPPPPHRSPPITSGPPSRRPPPIPTSPPSRPPPPIPTRTPTPRHLNDEYSYNAYSNSYPGFNAPPPPHYDDTYTNISDPTSIAYQYFNDHYPPYYPHPSNNDSSKPRDPHP